MAWTWAFLLEASAVIVVIAMAAKTAELALASKLEALAAVVAKAPESILAVIADCGYERRGRR
jgi:hypothetical protein